MLVEQWAFPATLVNSWPTHAADLRYLSLVHVSLPKGSHFAVVLLGVVQGGRGLPGQPNLDKKIVTTAITKYTMTIMSTISNLLSKFIDNLVPSYMK